jgi:hypothetical protein
MDIDRGIKVGMGLVVTHRTAEQLAPLLDDALAASIGEPLPPGAAARAVLGRPMRIDFDGDNSFDISFVAGMLSDLAA